MQKEDTKCRCFLPPFSAPPFLASIKVKKRGKCKFGENQSKIRFFSELFFIFYILFEDLSQIFPCRVHGKDAYAFLHDKFEAQGLWLLLSSGKKKFILMNSPSFLDEIRKKTKKNHQTGRTNLFLTCTDFWHLEAFHEVRDNEFTYWLAMLAWKRLLICSVANISSCSACKASTATFPNL